MVLLLLVATFAMLSGQCLAKLPEDSGSVWPVVTPSSVGLRKGDLDDALHFINQQVKDRQCFLVVKDGAIAYEWYDPKAPDPPLTPAWHGAPEDKPHHGYSMTKTVGGFLLLLAATEGGLDIDADITTSYGIPSPRPYAVTTRMMMAQVIGGDQGPGEMWRYDELGNMWLHLLPKVIQAATGHDAMHYLQRMRQLIGLSPSFTWADVNTKWFRGAAGSCRDWARFGQLILNRGVWNGTQVIARRFIDEMQQPVKLAPYNSYSNPCYGLLVWLNADKSKTPGCCWEASRLPNPKCNNETFMDGAVHDLTLNIGLYGQIVMTLPSVNTVVVGFGRDLRPIEPARIGYYPGVCKALGLPCTKAPPVPKTKCGELLECTGVSAQCFSGGSWSHKEPMPGKEQCVNCFRNRLPMYDEEFPEAQYMVKNWCPQDHKAAFKYIECFCGLTGENANPFAPWPSTTTTTPKPLPGPPSPAPRNSTTPPPSPLPTQETCQLSAKCIEGLRSHKECMPTIQSGGHRCYQGLKVWQKTLTEKYGCPDFEDKDTPTLEGKAFCWCGLAASASEYHTGLNTTSPAVTKDATHRHRQACRNRYDRHILRRKGRTALSNDVKACAVNTDGSISQAAQCMQQRDGLSAGCSWCYGQSIHCSEQHCIEECACASWNEPHCKSCMKRNCEAQFNVCHGESTDGSFVDVFGNGTNTEDVSEENGPLIV